MTGTKRAGTGIAAARRLAGAMVLIAAGAPALAHMPYVAPSVFDAGTRKTIAIEASFTEDAFRPEIVMNDAPFEITGPDGATTRLGSPARFADRAVVEAALPGDGIYRLSSGQRLGRMNRMVRDGTDWKILSEDAQAPAGASLVQVQSTTLADAYVVRGKPGAFGALKPRGAGLEIHPLGNPTAIGAHEAFPVEILFDGRPLPGATVSVFREAGLYDGRKTVADRKSAADGRVAITPPDAGRYLLLVRHRDRAPAGAAAPFYSYTATLAFEAT